MTEPTREETLKDYEELAQELDAVIEDVTFLDHVLMELGKDYTAGNIAAELARGYQRVVCRAVVALNNSSALLADMAQLLNGNGHGSIKE